MASALEEARGRAACVEDWLRVVVITLVRVARDYGVEREVLAELLSPTSSARGRRLALARTDQDLEAAREENPGCAGSLS